MKRYIAFLKGTNISSRNKIPMSGLETGFEELGLVEVKIYLNSDNVIFPSGDEEDFPDQLETIVRDRSDLGIPVFVVLKEELEGILHDAPGWWRTENKEIYDSLVFIMSPAIFIEIFNEIREPKEESEKIKDYKKTIFWSFNRKDCKETNWWSKIANANISSKLTVRTTNTVRKIVGV